MQNSPSSKNEPAITNQQILKLIADFICKYYIVCLILIYTVGTFMYVIDNLMAGFPFAALSIDRYAILACYLVIIIALPIFANFIQSELYKKQPHAKITSKLKTFWQCIGIEYLGLSLAFCGLMFLIMGDPIYILTIAVLTYILASFLGAWRGWVSFVIKTIFYSATVWTIILRIPVSAGGLKPLSVEFCAFETEQCQSYTFFGEADGLYHFRDGDTVILQPTDSGYLKYDHNAPH